MVNALLANAVEMTITSVASAGLGDVTMGSAVGNNNTFAQAGFLDGPGVSYFIEESNGDYEAGVGHLTTTQTILVRDQALEKSVGGTVTRLPATLLTATTSGIVSVKPNALMQLACYSSAPASGLIHIPHNTVRYDFNGKSGGEFGSLAGRITLVPMLLHYPMKISGLGAQVSTISAGGNFRIGIYNCDSDGKPGELIVDSGDISTAATGAIFATLSSALLLPAGVYYAADSADNVVATAIGPRTATSGNVFASPYGRDVPQNGARKPFYNQVYGAFPQTLPAPDGHHSWASFGIIWQ